VRDSRALAAVALTAVLVVLGLMASQRREPPPASDTSSPDAVVWALFRAQKEGKVSAYLALLTGDARRAVQQAVAEMGRRAFADYLRQRDAEIKGIALRERRQTPEGHLVALVDLVYTDGQEEHRFELVREGTAWRIARITGGERHPSLIPYGTPVVPPGEDQSAASASEAGAPAQGQGSAGQ